MWLWRETKDGLRSKTRTVKINGNSEALKAKLAIGREKRLNNKELKIWMMVADRKLDSQICNRSKVSLRSC